MMQPESLEPARDDLRDVNEQLLLAALREQELAEQLRLLVAERAAILAQVSDGIILTDAEGRITYVNAAARLLHGAAAIGVPIEDYTTAYHLRTLDGRPYPPGEFPLARAVRQGETVEGARWRINRPDGTDVVAEGSATPVLRDGGTRYGAVLICRDVTAEVGLEQQREDFFAAAAHDLRSPLTAIRGRAQFLRRKLQREPGPNPALVLDGLEQIEAITTQMATQLEDLLGVVLLQPGQSIDLHRQPTDLLALCRRAVAAREEQDTARDVTVVCQATAVMGSWDAARLERVVTNLLSNALKYSREGTPVRLTLTTEEREGVAWAVLTVQDQGIGIPAADLPYIFERFRRGRNVADRVTGIGIGLASVKRTVGQHGGQIGIESEEGRGATITVRLPLGG